VTCVFERSDIGGVMEYKKRVLIVDDNHFFREVMTNEFNEAGFDVLTAEDGEEGLQKFARMHPDVVIVDKIMPKMGGTRFMKRAQEHDFSKDVLFVTVSSMIAEPPHEHHHDVLGSKVHIPKTTKPVDIVILVEQLLSRKAAK
jgi:two-component system, OmpR family, response regulator